MTVYYQEITLPDGRIEEIKIPENATDDEVIAIAKRKWDAGEFGEPAGQIQQQQSQQQPDSTAGTENMIRDSVREGLQGMTMGWSDEIGAGLGALAAKAGGFFGQAGGDKPLKEIYNEMKGHLQDEQDAYREANPNLSTGINLASSFMTPLAGAAAVNRGSKLVSKAPQVSNFVKSLAQKGAQTVAKNPKKAAAASVLGQGAIAGAGEAEQGDTVGGALRGAAVSGLLGGTLDLGKLGLKSATQRRVARDLGEGENFVPLNVAAERGSGLQTFTQNTIGRSLGGKNIRDATARMLDKADENITGIEDKAVKDLYQSALPKSMKNSTVDLRDPAKTLKKMNDAWKREGFKNIKERKFKVNDRDLMGDIAKDLDDPAFNENKGGVFKHIEDTISKKMDRDTEWDGRYTYNAKSMKSQKTEPKPLATGTMTGDDLMEARNSLARDLNDDSYMASGDARLKKAALNKTLNKIDRVIKTQLPKNERAEYVDELKRWGDKEVLKTAQTKVADSVDDVPSIQQISTGAKQNNLDLAATLGGAWQRKSKDRLKDVTAAENEFKDILSRVPSDSGLAHKQFQSASVGLPVAEALGVLQQKSPTWGARVAGGSGLAKILSSQSGQRMLAGQTGWQKGTQGAIDKYRNTNIDLPQNERVQKWLGGKQSINTQQDIGDPLMRAILRMSAADAGDY